MISCCDAERPSPPYSRGQPGASHPWAANVMYHSLVSRQCSRFGGFRRCWGQLAAIHSRTTRRNETSSSAVTSLVFGECDSLMGGVDGTWRALLVYFVFGEIQEAEPVK